MLDTERRSDVAETEATLAATRLLCRLGGRVLGFEVVIKEAGVVLRGQARSYYAKQLAQQAVMQATAFPIVANEIEVFRMPRSEAWER